MVDQTEQPDGEVSHDFYRCKLCLSDPDKRISDAERFDLQTAEDYVEVLRHGIRDHSDSDELLDILSFEYATPCARCGQPFLSELRLVDGGLIVRNFCDDCADDEVETLVYRSVSVEEVLPLLTPSDDERGERRD